MPFQALPMIAPTCPSASGCNPILPVRCWGVLSGPIQIFRRHDHSQGNPCNSKAPRPAVPRVDWTEAPAPCPPQLSTFPGVPRCGRFQNDTSWNGFEISWHKPGQSQDLTQSLSPTSLLLVRILDYPRAPSLYFHVLIRANNSHKLQDYQLAGRLELYVLAPAL